MVKVNNAYEKNTRLYPMIITPIHNQNLKAREEEAANMSGEPVGDELDREQKRQQEDEGGVEKEKILSSLSEEEQQPDGESDALLKKEKHFIFEERIKDANLLKMRGNERLGNDDLKEAERNYRHGLYHVDMDFLQVKPFHPNHAALP